jgi:hypothetical protein
MNRNLEPLTDEGLLDRYRSTLVEAGRLALFDDRREELVKELARLRDALKSQGEASCAKMLSLLEDADPVVCLEAAVNCFEIAKDRSLAVIRSQTMAPDKELAARALFHILTDPAEEATPAAAPGGRVSSTPADYAAMSDQELVEHYRSVLIQAGSTSLDDIEINRLVSVSVGIRYVLKSRGDASLAALLPLLDDGDSRVRLGAAANCLDLARDKCIDVFSSLVNDRNRLVAAEAGLYLIQNAPDLASRIMNKPR